MGSPLPEEQIFLGVLATFPPPPSPPTAILFTKHSGRGQAESTACPHLCQENPARKQGVASTACHKCVVRVDLSPASMFLWPCVTGRDTCCKEWGGGKSSQKDPSPGSSLLEAPEGSGS